MPDGKPTLTPDEWELLFTFVRGMIAHMKKEGLMRPANVLFNNMGMFAPDRDIIISDEETKIIDSMAKDCEGCAPGGVAEEAFKILADHNLKGEPPVVGTCAGYCKIFNQAIANGFIPQMEEPQCKSNQTTYTKSMRICPEVCRK